MSTMASAPVMPCRPNPLDAATLASPAEFAIRVMTVVPVVSNTSPAQNITRCGRRSAPDARSQKTAIVYRTNATEIARWQA